MALSEQTDVKGFKIEEKMEESQIQKAFAGSAILLTGGTGFLGKLLVEKLLRLVELRPRLQYQKD